MQNYFEIFGLLSEYTIDKNLLEKNYFKLMQKYHPDQFIDKENKKIAYQNTININKAYETLNCDLLRAEYLLSLQGFILGTENDNVKPSQEILILIIEEREKLENIQNHKELYNFLKYCHSNYQHSKKVFQDLYNRQELNLAAETAIKMRYQHKLIIESERKLQQFKSLC